MSLLENTNVFSQDETSNLDSLLLESDEESQGEDLRTTLMPDESVFFAQVQTSDLFNVLGMDSENSFALTNSASTNLPSTNLPSTQELTADASVFAGPTDGQWHLENSAPGGYDMNVVPVWSDYTGAGVTVGVVDEGIQHSHPEFASNYDASIDWDFVLGNSDGGAKLSSDDHGTAVAGVIGAANDGVGTTGIAYGATLTSFRLLGGGGINSTQLIGALSQDVDISNNSWGWGQPFAASFFTDITESTFLDAVTNNRGGLGTIFVFSAGNSGGDDDNVNYHELQNSRFTVTVGAVNSDGTLASFSTPGASVLVSAPGTGIYTTDLVGSGGYSATNYATVQGTSFSAPAVSGVVALMLEANADLGWRDVQNILSMSAIQTDVSDPGWAVNGANNWNGGGLHFNHDFGFGALDARNAVRLSETWLLVDTEADVTSNELHQSKAVAIGVQDPAHSFGNGDPSVFVINIPPDQSIRIENIELQLTMTHARQQDLVITLTSPDGTESILFDRPPASTSSGSVETNYDSSLVLSSNAFRGELQTGNWTVTVTDEVGGFDGTIDVVDLDFYGSLYAPFGSTTYYFTDEYSDYANDPARNKVGNWDATTINASAVTSDSIINLSAGANSTIDGSNFSLINQFGARTSNNAMGGDGNDIITGNSENNLLYGGRGNDTLDGGLGIDTMYGGQGDDSFFVDSLSDVVIELAGEGFDTIFSTLSNYVLSANVELLQLIAGGDNITGSSGADTIVANDNANFIRGMDGNDIISGAGGDDTLEGGDGNDVLNGGTGNDILRGGLGDDIFIVDSAGDSVIENGGEGLDTVRSSVDFILGNGMDRLELQGTSNLNGTGNGGANDLLGNSGDNILTGGSGNDFLYGGTGSDTLIGGNENDIYAVDVSTDVIVELASAGGGNDKVFSVASDYTLSDNIETLQLAGTGNINGTGNSGINFMAGNSGNNTLSGGGGNDLINGSGGTDTLYGGLGDDRIIVDSMDDVAIELAGEGTADELQSLVDGYVLPENFERLRIVGSGDVGGTGNSGNNFIQGNIGNNTLNGGAGNDFLIGVQGTDTLSGGQGDDIMFLWTATDVAIENAGEGNDTVRSQVTTTLGDNIENLQLWFNLSIDGTGNALNNSLIGNLGNNTLTGLAGNDLIDGFAGINTLIGGTGNDTYVIHHVLDSIQENASEGSDMVRTLIDYTLGDNVENMILVSGDIDGTGNALNNVMTGSTGANTMNGASGNDTLNGLDGNDIINGDAGSDILIGGVGNDTLNGGDGSDTYLSFLAGFGDDIIFDTSGTDILNLTQYNVADIISWTAVDSGADSFVDQLLVSFSGGDSITINDYFDNTAITDDLSGAGSGLIETLSFADQSAGFADIQGLIA